jgi:hypothetical protein
METIMRKTSYVVAALIAMSSTAAFAAPPRAAVTQGRAIDECRQALFRDGGLDDHHKRPEVRACVERVEHGGPAVGDSMGEPNFY